MATACSARARELLGMFLRWREISQWLMGRSKRESEMRRREKDTSYRYHLQLIKIC